MTNDDDAKPETLLCAVHIIKRNIIDLSKERNREKCFFGDLF